MNINFNEKRIPAIIIPDEPLRMEHGYFIFSEPTISLLETNKSYYPENIGVLWLELEKNYDIRVDFTNNELYLGGKCRSFGWVDFNDYTFHVSDPKRLRGEERELLKNINLGEILKPVRKEKIDSLDDSTEFQTIGHIIDKIETETSRIINEYANNELDYEGFNEHGRKVLNYFYSSIDVRMDKDLYAFYTKIKDIITSIPEDRNKISEFLEKTF